MEEQCSECLDKWSSLKVCLHCHNSVCILCEDKHTKKRNHRFTFPSIYNHPTCDLHYISYESVCLSCGVLVCTDCLRGIHRKHRIKSVRSVADEQLQLVQNELQTFKRSATETEEQLKLRETHIHDFYCKARSMEKELKNDAERIDTLIFERRQQLLFIDKPELNENLRIILKENRSLKHSLKTNKVIIKALSRLIESRSDPCKFIESYAIYRDILDNCVKLPRSVNDDFLQELKINYFKHTEEEINAVLPVISFGKMSPKPREHAASKTGTKNVSVIDHEEKMKTELDLKKQEIKLLKNAVYGLLNHAKLVSTEFRERNKGPVPIQFKRPGGTTSIPEIEEMITTFESRMQDVFNVINERDTEIKYLKSGNATGGVQSAGIQDYRQKLEEKNKELNTLKIQLTDAQKGQSRNRGNELEKQQIQELRERKNSLEKNFELAQKQIEDRSKEIENLKRCLDQFDEESSKTKKELKAKIKDNEDLRTRLSQVAGAKLVAGNTSIADLGDKFRPTRIAELYSELYDNDWTEAVDNFSKQEWPEEVIVQHLFITLQGCYIACSQLANQQLQDLVQKLSLDTSSQDGITKFRESHTTEIRQLVDARKGTAMDVANSISKNLYKNQKFDEVLRSYKWMKDDIVRQITKLTFFEKCVTVCWLMVVQDPEMYIADNLRPGMKFDKEHYREYTKSGPKVDYSVWPALYLHKNGPLMIKGVAQACD